MELRKWEENFWHTSAHLLDTALQKLYSGIKFGIGPAIDNRLYYDIDFGENKFTPEEFPKIEKKMQNANNLYLEICKNHRKSIICIVLKSEINFKFTDGVA